VEGQHAQKAQDGQRERDHPRYQPAAGAQRTMAFGEFIELVDFEHVLTPLRLAVAWCPGWCWLYVTRV